MCMLKYDTKYDSMKYDRLCWTIRFSAHDGMRMEHGSCVAIPAESSTAKLRGLLSVNAAAQLIYSVSKYNSVTPLLCQLLWLKASEQIQFSLAALVYRCLHGAAPPYLVEVLHYPWTVVAETGHRLHSTQLNSSLFKSCSRKAKKDSSSSSAPAIHQWLSFPSGRHLCLEWWNDLLHSISRRHHPCQHLQSSEDPCLPTQTSLIFL